MNDSRSQILARIRGSLAANGGLLEQQGLAYLPPHPHGPFVATDLEPVSQFEAELSALHGHVYLCDGPAAALEQILELLHAIGAREALAWSAENMPLPELLPRLSEQGIRVVEPGVLGADRRARYNDLEPIPVCISGADAAIAESGTLVVVSGGGRGRLASLMAPMHIALLSADRIVRTLPDAFDLLREQFGPGLFRDRSNVTLITGPSRTADIELSLTLGVHGPRDIHAIVIR